MINRNFLFVFLFFIKLDLWACMPMDKYREEQLLDPKNSKAIMLVRMKGNHLVTSEPFEANKFSISQDCGKMDAPQGKLLLMQSKDSLSSLKTFPFVVDGQVVVRSLQDLPDKFVDKLLKVSENPKGHPNVFWAYCKSQDDCTLSENDCGINIKSLEAYKKYLVLVKKKVACPIKKISKDMVKCVENFCK